MISNSTLANRRGNAFIVESLWLSLTVEVNPRQAVEEASNLMVKPCRICGGFWVRVPACCGSEILPPQLDFELCGGDKL